MLKKLNSGDFQGAAREFVSFNNAGGKENAHLTGRRKTEAALFVS